MDKKNMIKKKYRQGLNKKSFDTQLLDNGIAVTREQYVETLVFDTKELGTNPFIFEGMTVLDGFKGIVYYFLNDSIKIIQKYIEGEYNENSEAELQQLYLNMDLLYKLIVLQEITPFEAYQRICDFDESSDEPYRLSRNFTLDPRFNFSIIEKVYLANLLISVVTEFTQARSILDTDISSTLVFFEAMYALRFKNLDSKKKIASVDIRVGKGDKFIDVDFHTVDGEYSELEYRNLKVVFFVNYKAYDNRGNEEIVLRNKFPYFKSETIGDLAFCQFQQGKTRGVQKNSISNDQYWKKSYIIPLLNSFESEIRHLTDILLESAVNTIGDAKAIDMNLYQAIILLKNDDRLVNRIQVLKMLIIYNMDCCFNNYDQISEIEHQGCMVKAEYFFNQLDSIRKIRNNIMHGNNIDDSQYLIVESYIPAALHIMHFFLQSKVFDNTESYNYWSKDMVPNWVVASSDSVYNYAVHLRTKL